MQADGIAYRLVRELEDLIKLAGDAMRQANASGSKYEVEDELASARLAVEAYKTFCAVYPPPPKPGGTFLKITESRANDILRWLDAETENYALLFEKMTLFRDTAALIRQLQAAEQAAWHAGLDAGRARPSVRSPNHHVR